MKISRKLPKYSLASAVKQFPWSLSKMIQLKRRKWAKLKFSKRLLAQRGKQGRALNFKFFRTYKQKTKQLFRRYFAPSLTDRQCKKLFRSNPRYKATFQKILRSEYRLDTLIFRLYMLPDVFLARDLIKRKFFLLNGKEITAPKVVANIGDLLEPSNLFAWQFLYQNLFRNVASVKKYLSRIFFKFSFPFVSKRENSRLKEYGKFKHKALYHVTRQIKDRIARRFLKKSYRKVTAKVSSRTKPALRYYFRKTRKPLKQKRNKAYYLTPIKQKKSLSFLIPWHVQRFNKSRVFRFGKQELFLKGVQRYYQKSLCKTYSKIQQRLYTKLHYISGNRVYAPTYISSLGSVGQDYKQLMKTYRHKKRRQKRRLIRILRGVKKQERRGKRFATRRKRRRQRRRRPSTKLGRRRVRRMTRLKRKRKSLVSDQSLFTQFQTKALRVKGLVHHWKKEINNAFRPRTVTTYLRDKQQKSRLAVLAKHNLLKEFSKLPLISKKRKPVPFPPKPYFGHRFRGIEYFPRTKAYPRLKANLMVRTGKYFSNKPVKKDAKNTSPVSVNSNLGTAGISKSKTQNQLNLSKKINPTKTKVLDGTKKSKIKYVVNLDRFKGLHRRISNKIKANTFVALATYKPHPRADKPKKIPFKRRNTHYNTLTRKYPAKAFKLIRWKIAQHNRLYNFLQKFNVKNVSVWNKDVQAERLFHYKKSKTSYPWRSKQKLQSPADRKCFNRFLKKTLFRFVPGKANKKILSSKFPAKYLLAIGRNASRRGVGEFLSKRVNRSREKKVSFVSQAVGKQKHRENPQNQKEFSQRVGFNYEKAKNISFFKLVRNRRKRKLRLKAPARGSLPDKITSRFKRILKPFWRRWVPKYPRAYWQANRITKKRVILFRYLKKFNNRYKQYSLHQKLWENRWVKQDSFWQKTSFLYEKKRKRLMTTVSKAVVLSKRALPSYQKLTTKTNSESVTKPKTKKEGAHTSGKLTFRKILRIKRKYLKIKGLYRKYKNYKVEVQLADESNLFSPIQISYKKINLLSKHRPIAYYFAEANYNTLDFTIVGDVDFLFFPYRTAFDFKMLSFMYHK